MPEKPLFIPYLGHEVLFWGFWEAPGREISQRQGIFPYLKLPQKAAVGHFEK
jgi:hypothetical protein